MNSKIAVSIKDIFRKVSDDGSDAESMKNDPVYDEILRQYDEELEKLTLKIFNDDYLEEH